MLSSLQGKNILVTGGTGQIGSFLAERLVNEKANVILLGRNPDRYYEIKQLIESEKVEFIRCDLNKENQITRNKNKMKGVEYLLHLSSAMVPIYQDFYKNARFDVRLNIKGTINLLKNMKEVKKICYASSMAVYGAPAYNPVDEKSPTEPLNTYGVTKLATEKLLQIFSRSIGIPLSIVRYSSVYGPRNLSHRALPTFIRNAIDEKNIVINGDGSVLRDYVYVSDAVDGTLRAIRNEKNSVFNIGYGKGCSVRKLAETILKLTQSKNRIVFNKTTNDFDFVYNISKAEKELSYRPKIDLEKGLKNEIEWHLKN